jgi:serine/threonine protein kinase
MLGGKHRITDRLGQFGAVELASAVDTTTGQAVAIERLPLTAAVPAAAQQCRERLRALGKLQHKHLLQVLDCFEHAGALHVVTEPLTGESLAARLTREAVSVSQLSTWLADAMRAVASLHRQELFLRGVSPATIFLTGADRAAAPTIKVVPLVLADFCVQAVSDAQLGYCSMEQLAGATDLDARNDVYAFGAIAYQAFTGRLPFEADSPAATRLRVMTENAEPLKRARPDLPDELCTLIDLALAKRREARLSSLDSMLALLEPCTDQFSRRREPLLTVQLAAATAQLRQPEPLSLLNAAEPSSLQPIDKPITSALPQPSAAGAAMQRKLTALRAPLLTLGAFGVALLAGWTFSQRGTAGSLATEPLSVPVQAAARPASRGPATTMCSDGSFSARCGAVTKALPQEAKPASTAALNAAPEAAEAAPAGDDVLERGSQLRASSRAMSAVRAAARRSTSATTLRAAQPEPTAPATTRPECSPNYVFDAQGEKHWKPECF